MEPWLQHLKETLSKYIKKEERCLIAVSGGVDSTVLCYLFYHFNYRFAIVHLNYSLRNADSDADEAFVGNLAEQFGVPYHVKKVPKNEKPVKGVQEWAREVRYQFFSQIMDQFGYKYLVLAHHKDDQIEQFFLKAMRPSGVFSLAGMKTVEGKRLRPLLQASKGDLRL